MLLFGVQVDIEEAFLMCVFRRHVHGIELLLVVFEPFLALFVYFCVDVFLGSPLPKRGNAANRDGRYTEINKQITQRFPLFGR